MFASNAKQRALSSELTEKFKAKMYPEIKMQLNFEPLQIVCPSEVTTNPEIQRHNNKREKKGQG